MRYAIRRRCAVNFSVVILRSSVECAGREIYVSHGSTYRHLGSRTYSLWGYLGDFVTELLYYRDLTSGFLLCYQVVYRPCVVLAHAHRRGSNLGRTAESPQFSPSPQFCRRYR